MSALVLSLAAIVLPLAAWQEGSEAPAGSAHSVHRNQNEELGAKLTEITEDGLEAQRLEAAGKLFPQRSGDELGLAFTAYQDDDPFVVFGYLQSESQIFHTRWQALTHVGSLFVGFDSNGNLTSTSAFTGRSSYLKAGGAAEAAGVKVILVVTSFDDSPGGVIEDVMTDSGRRATLVAGIVSLLSADSYAHGVSLDLEFSWGTSVRDGITAFMGELRTALDLVNPDYELSIYTNAIFNANQWDFDAETGITPEVDYMLYSMYDWATGLTAHAISDFDNDLGPSRMHGYLNDGLPAEKLVPVVSAYSRRWNGIGVYNGTGSGSASSGFTDGLFDVSLNTGFGGPYPANYVRGDECGWYSWNDGTLRTRTWESLEGIEYKLRGALSLQDPSGAFAGRRLGGVGFWSLMWMAETSSIDPRTGQAVSRTRTYPHVYQRCQEILGPRGQLDFTLEGFEGLDFRWRDPNDSPDTLGDSDADSARALVAAPLGAGAPDGSVNAMQLSFDLEGVGANQAVLAHEILASGLAPAVADLNATAAHFDATTRLSVQIHSPAPYAGYSLRMLVVDAAGELEASQPFALDLSGWRELAWNLTDPAQLVGLATLEPALANGDGILDSAAGTADLSFFGFLVEGSGALAGTIVLDEVAYRHETPDGLLYSINELRYVDSAQEFVEIHGPAGALPAGLELRSYDSQDGSVFASTALSGTIPDLGGGFGLLVVGDPSVPGVDLALFGATSDDLPNADPSAIQLLDTGSGAVYDSLVYEAFGGLDDLIRSETFGVTDNGFPWCGEIAGGSDASGRAHTLGRYPDGARSEINFRDFSLMPASPGAPNGGSLTPDTKLEFDTPPARAFQTFKAFSVSDPVAAGLPASPSGGAAYRCVDTTGGGVIGILGDAALGAERGYAVSGELYLPRADEPAQAIAIGLCARQGSRFFTSTQQHNSAYESGFWLIYENRAGVGLADGRSDHPGTFELVHATHDNQDASPTELLAAIPLVATAATEGAWTHFELALDHGSSAQPELRVRLGGALVYTGPIPAGAPTSGAFQVGFRENHAGPPAACEGTWVDGLRIRSVGPRVTAERLPSGGLHSNTLVPNVF